MMKKASTFVSLALLSALLLAACSSTKEQTKQFTIPGHLLSGATPLRFIMESSGPQPDVLSESFVVTPGEEVILVIPNFR